MNLSKKDEIRIKEEFLDSYSNVERLEDPFEDGSKVGRVVNVRDGFVEVDFYNSSPAKFTVKTDHIELVSRFEDREDLSGEPMGSIEAPPLKFLNLDDGEEREHKTEYKHLIDRTPNKVVDIIPTPKEFAETLSKAVKATDVQVGGGHYKHFEIQPIEFTVKNKLGFCEGNIIKYVCRHKFKNGLEDLKKAKHYIDLLIEMEYETK